MCKLLYLWVFWVGMCVGVFSWYGIVKVVECLKVVSLEIWVLSCSDLVVVVEGVIVLVERIWLVFEYIDIFFGVFGIMVCWILGDFVLVLIVVLVYEGVWV